jgi:hypothetical protein
LKFRVSSLYPSVLRTYRAAMFSPRSPSGSFGFLPPGTSFIWGLKLQSFCSQFGMTQGYRKFPSRTKNPARRISSPGKNFV